MKNKEKLDTEGEHMRSCKEEKENEIKKREEGC